MIHVAMVETKERDFLFKSDCPEALKSDISEFLKGKYPFETVGISDPGEVAEKVFLEVPGMYFSFSTAENDGDLILYIDKTNLLSLEDKQVEVWCGSEDELLDVARKIALQLPESIDTTSPNGHVDLDSIEDCLSVMSDAQFRWIGFGKPYEPKPEPVFEMSI